MFRSDMYSKIISNLNKYDESEFPGPLDGLTEEKYNLWKEDFNHMAKKKKAKKKKKKAKAKKKKKR